MVIRVCNQHLDFYLHTWHAPHATDGRANKEWWQKTSELLQRWPAGIVLADTNGRLAHNNGGEPLYSADDANGSELRRAIDIADLMAINTILDIRVHSMEMSEDEALQLMTLKIQRNIRVKSAHQSPHLRRTLN